MTANAQPISTDPYQFELGKRQTANDILYMSRTSSQLNKRAFESLLGKQNGVLRANSTVLTQKPATIMPLTIPKRTLQLACQMAQEIVHQRGRLKSPLILDLVTIGACQSTLPFVVDTRTCAFHLELALLLCLQQFMVF